MAHLAEGAERLATDALGRRLRRHQLRMLGLQGLQLTEQAVVLGVRHARLVQYVIAVVVLIQFGTKCGNALGGVGHAVWVLENDKSSLGCSWDCVSWSA